jgi:hypothetical protein
LALADVFLESSLLAQAVNLNCISHTRPQVGLIFLWSPPQLLLTFPSAHPLRLMGTAEAPAPNSLKRKRGVPSNTNPVFPARSSLAQQEKNKPASSSGSSSTECSSDTSSSNSSSETDSSSDDDSDASSSDSSSSSSSSSSPSVYASTAGLVPKHTGIRIAKTSLTRDPPATSTKPLRLVKKAQASTICQDQ